MIPRAILIIWSLLCCGLVWIQLPALVRDPRCSGVGVSLLLGGVLGFVAWVAVASVRMIRKANT